ncbi:hypothetical protein [Actinoplanes sp. NPDC051851]|uniref:hypothetical protein n=1 Tax=Actinoplanes sp. NPDC051851 TaxID=3154753 RepID=UPI0034130102
MSNGRGDGGREPVITVDIYAALYTERKVSLSEVPALYAALGDWNAAFTWNDCEDEVLIVNVGEDYSTATILTAGSFYDLDRGEGAPAEVGWELTEDGESVYIEMAGDVTEHPIGLVSSRATGLELLMRMPDFASVVERYRWRVEE